jgi:hypothetical protein
MKMLVHFTKQDLSKYENLQVLYFTREYSQTKIYLILKKPLEEFLDLIKSSKSFWSIGEESL